ncbi:aldehyde dehydrogenase family protein [Clostridium sp. KNHs216]|uniref:aldehyde dehydrogenase family protein n=1 Tax=Clostridium sp. KNHs216 TaxID=1550235 RepID=UPI0011523E7B|nr:aldehyde dehydrogenase family protein [Clostridium sp. KNHs216]TQI67051.1 succinate-semialdehyde dehydrogenase/glutarate-semialdehyde dehydrogenase [Clostridium sp. KNHs216]
MKMLMDGKWVDSSDGAVQNVINPANGEIVDTVPSATREDVTRAIDLAEKAQPAWAKMPVRERCKILRKFSAACIEKRMELGKILSKETGKPYLAESVWEFDSVAYVFDGACEIAMHHYGKTLPIATEPGYDTDVQFTVNEPLGVIACIIPYNFPAALWAFKVAASLAAGNAVVIKAPSYDPMAVLTMSKMLVDAGVPGGVVNCLTGKGSLVGDWLVDDFRIASVNFTGSTETGISIAKTAAKHLTGYQFELGGNDPFIVCEDGDLELALREAGDKARNAGQCCSAAKRFIIHNSLKEEFCRRLVDEYLKPLVLGDPFDPKTTMGPVISEAMAKKVVSQIEKTVEQGAKVYYGGKRSGAFVDPTVLVDVTDQMDITKNMEVFGPVWPVIGFDTVEEAIRLANLTDYGLSSGVFTKDMKTAAKFCRQIKAGYVAVNGSGGFRAAELPFGGGKKLTGNSRESLMTLMDEVTQKKSIILRYILED